MVLGGRMCWVIGERNRGFRFVRMEGGGRGLRRTGGGEIGVLVVMGGVVRLITVVVDGAVEALTVVGWRELSF